MLLTNMLSSKKTAYVLDILVGYLTLTVGIRLCDVKLLKCSPVSHEYHVKIGPDYG